MESWRARWRHFRDGWHLRVVTATTGAALWLASLLTWVRDEFVADPAITQLRLLSLLPEWPWQAWALTSTPFVFVAFFEGSFQNRRRLEEELQSARRKIFAVADDRPVSINMAAVDFQTQQINGGSYLRRVTIPIQNRSQSLMRYRSSGGFIQWKDKLPISIQGADDIRHLAPDVGLSHYLDVQGDFQINDGDQITLGFSIEYDNFSPVRWRKTGREVTYTVQSLSPSKVTTLIKSETEE